MANNLKKQAKKVARDLYQLNDSITELYVEAHTSRSRFTGRILTLRELIKVVDRTFRQINEETEAEG